MSISNFSLSTQLSKKRKILDHNQLPDVVKQLDRGSLAKLVNYLGLEESSEILALATKEQLKSLLDDSIWTNAKPGQVKTFDVPRLYQWLRALNDIGGYFAAQKFVEFGEAFSTLCFNRLFKVLDIECQAFNLFEEDDSASSFQSSNRSEDEYNFGQYSIIFSHTENRDLIIGVLNHLWQTDSEFLTNVFRRCYSLHDNNNSIDRQNIYLDAAYQQQAEDEKKGFVTPENASIFLQEANSESLDNLITEDNYDKTTKTYFEFVEKTAQATTDTALHLSGNNRETSNQNQKDRISDLQIALRDVGISQSSADHLLLDKPASHHEQLRIKQAMGLLEAESLVKRKQELVYLSNVLISGATMKGELFANTIPFTEDGAANTVAAIANLGLDYLALNATRPPENKTDFFACELNHAPGAVKAFRIGWHLLHQIPLRTAEAIETSLTSSKVQLNLRDEPWILDEVNKILGRKRFSNGVTLGNFTAIKEALDIYQIITDANASHALSLLLVEFPTFPSILHKHAEKTIFVNKGFELISTIEQLNSIQHFLDDLASTISL